MELDSESGKISGIPTTVGIKSFTIKAENSIGSATRKFKISVIGEKPAIITRALPDAVVNMPYELPIEISGSNPIKLKLLGSLPAGLQLKKKDRMIIGTPKKEGTYNFSLVVRKAGEEDKVDYTLVVKKTEEEKKEEPSVTTSTVMTTVIGGAQPVQEENTSGRSDLYTSLYMLSGDEKLEGIVNHTPKTLAYFIIDDWIDRSGASVKVSDVKIFVNDKILDGVTVSDDGTFTISEDIVSGEFNVYASAFTDEHELKTSEVYVSAIESAGNENAENSVSSSGAGCDLIRNEQVGIRNYLILLFFVLGLVLMRFKRQ